MKNWSVQKKTAFGFLLTAALFCSTAFFWSQNWNSFLSSSQWVAHTYAVIEDAEDILSQIQQLVAEQRGYVILGDIKLLKPMQMQITELQKSLDGIQTLTKDNPPQQQRIDQLKSLAKVHVNFVQKVSHTRQNDGFEAAYELIASRIGVNTMEAIRTRVAEIVKEEKRLLAIRQERTQSHAKGLTFLSILVGGLIGLIFIFLYVMINRALKERESANDLLEGEIEERRRIEVDLIEANQTAQKALKAKSEFLAVISHEIRTPMNGVVGMTGLLFETTLNSEQKEYAETIRKSGEALIALINDLLDFSKMEYDRLELENQPFKIRHCVEDAIDLMIPKAIEKDLDLFYQIDPGLPLMLDGDVTRLRQVLVNLISNAIKFTAKGHIYVQVFLSQSLQDKVELHFTVSDTGIGIPSDKLGKIFEAFSQADSSTTRKYGGTGLGLSISDKIVQHMGGSMWVESEVGKGSTFHFTIVADQTTVCPLPTNETHLNGKKALIIDSHPLQRRLLEAQVRLWGMTPVVPQNAKEASEQLASPPPETAVVLFHSNELQDARFLSGIHARNICSIIICPFKKNHTARGLFADSRILLKPYRHEQLKSTLVEALTSEVGISKITSTQGQLDPKLAEKYPLHIMIAEDHPVNQKLAKLLLEKMGYLPDIVGNGLEALAALQVKQYDLIFMDVQMPEMDGIEATRQICQRYPKEKRPIIVAMTAYASQGDKTSCIEAGMNDFIRKPILKGELQDSLKKWGHKTALAHAQPNLAPETHSVNPAPAPTAPSLVPTATLEVIDRTLLLERVDFDQGLMNDLISLFVTECPKLLEKLRDAIAQREYHVLHPVSHTLNGMCRNMCIPHMQDIAQTMENATVNLETIPAEETLSEWLRLMEGDFEAVKSTAG